MKVFLDPQIFITQKFGGISRLFVELWKHSTEQKDIEFYCPLIYSENFHLQESNLAPKNIFNLLNHLHFRGTSRIKDLLKKNTITRANKKLGQGEYDVFLATYYDDYFLHNLKGKPFVLTVYDMIHELFPRFFYNDKTTIPRKKLLIETASAIVAISEQTKKDILHFYPEVPDEKIQVVYLSQSIDENASVKKIQLPEKYILFIGNRAAYKNFKLFAEAVTIFMENDPSLYVVCAGGGKMLSDETEMLRKLGVENKIIQISYNDNELSQFYKSAKMFVFPSAYEGFGIPTLEAMQCGCPVILADSSCLPEVGGDAAMYFISDNKESMQKVIGKVLQDEELRNNMIKKGYKRASEFSWQKTAQGYYSIIKKLTA